MTDPGNPLTTLLVGEDIVHAGGDDNSRLWAPCSHFDIGGIWQSVDGRGCPDCWSAITSLPCGTYHLAQRCWSARPLAPDVTPPPIRARSAAGAGSKSCWTLGSGEHDPPVTQLQHRTG